MRSVRSWITGGSREKEEQQSVVTSAFFDAFPNIVPEEEVLRDLLLHVTVTRVTMDSNRTLLRIYISSDRLIQKKDIDRIESKGGGKDA